MSSMPAAKSSKRATGTIPRFCNGLTWGLKGTVAMIGIVQPSKCGAALSWISRAVMLSTSVFMFSTPKTVVLSMR